MEDSIEERVLENQAEKRKLVPKLPKNRQREGKENQPERARS